jgi:hypothetical protein
LLEAVPEMTPQQQLLVAELGERVGGVAWQLVVACHYHLVMAVKSDLGTPVAEGMQRLVGERRRSRRTLEQDADIYPLLVWANKTQPAAFCWL